MYLVVFGYVGDKSCYSFGLLECGCVQWNKMPLRGQARFATLQCSRQVSFQHSDVEDLNKR